MAQQFNKILCVLSATDLSETALETAIKQQQASGGEVEFLVLMPEFKLKQAEISAALEASVSEKIAKYSAAPTIHSVSKKPYFVEIVQAVLRNEYDLVIKAAESDDKGHAGFKSLDMSLLRKCPCPLWLLRPERELSSGGYVLTAVDPYSEAAAGHDLNIKLLQLGAQMADQLNLEHKVIACWDFEYEDYLRNSAFGKIASDEVDAHVEEAETNHRLALDKLVDEANIAPPKIIHERGQAGAAIPAKVSDDEVGLVVMGTVARTGIPGFLIGNTAENVLQNLTSSLLAVKPNGFVTPVKAY